jgi:hypothetical protein
MRSSHLSSLVGMTGLGGVMLLGLALSACGSDTGADPSATAIPVGDDGKSIAATKDGITAYLNAKEYLGWAKEPAVRDAIRSHGGRARSYFNKKYLEARQKDAYPMQLGAMAVKELYSGDSVTGYAVGIKTRSGAGAETWTWYETVGLPEVKYFGVANPTCEGCHSADSGRDRSLAPTIP